MEDQYTDGEQSNEVENKFKTLKKKLKECEKERKEYLEGWQRARADFQNYIKQKDMEVASFRNFAREDLIQKIFPILDNLTLAESSTPENLKADSWVKGVINVKRQLENMLKEEGVEEIKVMEGDELNPFLHEAIGETESSIEQGKITEVARKGYAMHGKVIRAARVRVAK